MVLVTEKEKIPRQAREPKEGKYIGVIGSRTLHHTLAEKVGDVTEAILKRGYNISTGGAVGADEFCLGRIVHLGYANRATVFAAWALYAGFPQKVRAQIQQFKAFGGSILWGLAQPKQAEHIIKVALLQRNERLTQACYGLVAFINATSRGSLFTINKIVQMRKPIVVFPFECGLPQFDCVKWVALRCGGCWEGGFKAVYLR